MIKKKKRPLGVSIISFFSIVGGVCILLIQFWFAANFEDISASTGFSVVLLFGSILFLGLLYLSSGIGMWLGKWWGWWLAIFGFVYSVLRSVNVLVMVYRLGDLAEELSRGVEYYYSTRIGRIMFGLFFLGYLFRGNVREYFNVTHYSKKKIAIVVALFSVGVFAFSSLLALI